MYIVIGHWKTHIIKLLMHYAHKKKKKKQEIFYAYPWDVGDNLKGHTTAGNSAPGGHSSQEILGKTLF